MACVSYRFSIITRMLTVILWKHLQIRFHNVSSIVLTICELLIPVTVFLATIYAKSNAGDFDKVYINTSTYVDPIEKQELLTRLNVGSTMFLYAPDTQFTDAIMREVQLKLMIYNEWSDTYLEKTFGATQAAMDISFIEMVTNSTFNTSLSFQEFPYPPHLNTDGVTTSFRFILPLITIISFIFICPITLKRVVLEKSSGLKELQKIAGVKSRTLWLGWFLNGIILNAVSAFAIAIILKHAVFSTKYAIIEHCNFVLLALFLVLYCAATITFFFAFSTWFHRGTLAMVFGVLLWIISYIIFVGVSPHIDVMGAIVKGFFLLFPPFALYFGYNTISLFEIRETDITFLNLFESPTSNSDDLSLGIVMTILFADAIFYFLLTMYLDKIWPGPYGISKPWYFLMQSLWKRKPKGNVIDASTAEMTPLSLEKSILKPVVELKSVTKIYDNNVAVNSLSMNIYEGAITTLLGENGAGKSTTMGMIAGLTKANSGEIWIAGAPVDEYAELARKTVSICTQHDLLYDELNVIQHLILFGRLKGLSEKDARKQAIELLQNTLNMCGKERVFVSQLSGGMKRKLSLGIALMGDPKVRNNYCPTLAFMIVFLTLWLGKSGFVDVSKDGTRIPLDLSLYGNTDVYYSITGGSHQTKIDEYFKNVIASSKSVATKVSNVSDMIIEKGTENIAHYMKRMIIAAELTFDDEDLTTVNIMHANKPYHGAPISMNAVMNTILKYYAGDDYSISTSNTPLHARTRKEQALSQSEFTNLFLWLTLLPIGPLLLISAVLCLPATEYMKSTRILEKLCGISTPEYWLCNFLIDIFCYAVLTLFIMWATYFIPIHFMDATAMGYLLVILLVYGLACIPFAYTFTFTQTVEGAYAKFLILHIICAPIIAAILLVLEIAETSSGLITVIKSMILTFEPHVSLCVYLGRMSIKIISNHNWDIMAEEKKRFLCSENLKNHPCCGMYFEKNIVLANCGTLCILDADSQECVDHRAYIDNYFYIYAAIALLFYMMVLLIGDPVSQYFARSWYRFCGWKYDKNCPLDKQGETTKEKTKNEKTTDVDNNFILKVKEVSKAYFSMNSFSFTSAVKRLTFNLAKGKCLGLLGVNGAGKSTSFRLLTEELIPTLGELEKTATPIGYCPQQNALLDELTGRELLQLYGNLRIRLAPKDMVKMINDLLEKFDLVDIAGKPCGTYSGGNKRKLATCISMIGFPPCILLDEPTSGVDPISRRELWDLIEGIKRNKVCGLILTSHSMDECEALCDSVCILKKGKAEVNATIEDLRKKYCVGHILSVKLKLPSKPAETLSKKEASTSGADETDKNAKTFEQYLYDHFNGENVKILGIHNSIMYVKILNSSWSTIFRKIDPIKEKGEYIEDYMLKEASLEDVLIQIAKKDDTTSNEQHSISLA
ncbi:atp-binding cassette transporter subfamily a abca [Holotrichia oblita]|uniref:Atp-binding cassette transporter subfamily a abca n=1 Tax=Holotrichia oblita TaxID=644536 RepID=A0ACB9TQC4_HOLOL|nr:atp-binding cassette transporter subfamily a abca [Holotrichia oblita]